MSSKTKNDELCPAVKTGVLLFHGLTGMPSEMRPGSAQERRGSAHRRVRNQNELEQSSRRAQTGFGGTLSRRSGGDGAGEMQPRKNQVQILSMRTIRTRTI